METKINFLRPFGPAVAKIIIPNEILEKLNDYFDQVTKDEEKLKSLNHGHKLAGNVKQELKLDHKFITESGWLAFLGNAVKEYVKFGSQGKQITKFNLIDSWIVSQYKNEYNPTHWHGGHVSGAGFLKVPKNMGKPFQEKNKSMPNGVLQLIHGSRQFLNPSLFYINPKVGEFYLFPNYLMHTVFPFSESDEERRSISFNAFIDDDIYNVYS